jgi:myo-inositol-hexaphosphate 3-phosphohydrolase
LKNQLFVSSNPSNGFVNFRLPADFNYKNAVLSIYDLSGKQVYSKKFSDRNLNVDLRNNAISSGVYVVKVEDFGKDNVPLKSLMLHYLK